MHLVFVRASVNGISTFTSRNFVLFPMKIDSFSTKRKLQRKLNPTKPRLFSQSQLGVWQILHMGLVFITGLCSV